MKIIPKNWRDFQHYKDRNPPWIRLHKGLLDNYEYQRLPLASRALAPMLWLLASDSVDGVIDADPDKLAFRLRMELSEVNEALSPLISNGFFEVVEGDVVALAPRLRLAVPEAETEALQKNTTATVVADSRFDEFWKAYPRKVGKDAAFKAFAKRKPSAELTEEMIAAVMAQKRTDAWCKDGGQYIPHPSTWLNEGRWQDEVSIAIETAANTAEQATKVYIAEHKRDPEEIRAAAARARAKRESA